MVESFCWSASIRFLSAMGSIVTRFGLRCLLVSERKTGPMRDIYDKAHLYWHRKAKMGREPDGRSSCQASRQRLPPEAGASQTLPRSLAACDAMEKTTATAVSSSENLAGRSWTFMLSRYHSPGGLFALPKDVWQCAPIRERCRMEEAQNRHSLRLSRCAASSRKRRIDPEQR